MPESGTRGLSMLFWGLGMPVLVLIGFGLASIHATDRSNARLAAPLDPREASSAAVWMERVAQTIGPLTIKQGLFVVAGVVLMAVLTRIPYQKFGPLAHPFYWIVIVLLVLLVLDRFVDLPLIPVKRNTRRWIELGPFTLQPSEFMKVALVVALARYLRFRSSYRRWLGLVPPFLLTLLPMVLILRQPDLGTLLMLLPALFAMLFVAGARLRHLATIVLLGLATLPLFYFFGMKDYQRQRVLVVFRQGVDDERWHMDQGYQLRQSKVALGMGGVFGEGYGEGLFVRHGLLPEEHNDFIFAIIGNQIGLIGGLIVILAYGVIVLVGLEIATATNDPFGRLLAVGMVVMIAAQALLNICMTVGLAPITGMPLPFVSYGGSSLLANFIALGLLVNVGLRRPMLIAKPPFEYTD